MHHPTGKRAMLVLCNVILIVGMIFAAVLYSSVFTEQKNTLRRDTFCSTIESLKQVSENYLNTEKGYVNDWAAYIEAQHMTAEEALDYIRTTNTQKERSAHLVNMEDLSARSSYLSSENDWVHYYEETAKLDTEDSKAFLNKLNQMYEDQSDELLVLGKYRVAESQRTVISVGTGVMIRESDGTDKPYLLLRLVPAEYMQRSWIFPTEYANAEISLIARDGGYVVQSPSLRSKNFLEFIRAYNFADNYNQVNDLAQQLKENERGLLKYKDSKGQECYFYYSSMGENTDLAVLGYIPADKLQTEGVEWNIAFLISGTILILMIIDGGYILSMNKKLRLAVQMEESANMAKTQFLSSMSHDIRTPMNAVLGMTEIAKHHLDDPTYVKDCLDKVSRSGNHLLTLVNDILDISKVESGKMTLNRSAFSVTDLAEEMKEMVRQAAADKDIELLTDIHDISQEYVVGDNLRLRQIVINLLTNAVKYTEAGGHVWFSVSEKWGQRDGSICLCISVRDDGMGMSAEFQKQMYSTFSRETDSRINAIQGSGLGLAIAKQLTDLMEGTITCTSEPGRGTEFQIEVELPIAREAERHLAYTGTDIKPDEFKGMRVLIAEDNDLNWEIIHIMLEEYGVISERAENGKICLNMLEEKGADYYDLILMDVQMPEMNGREAAREIRKKEEAAFQMLPIYAMTADAFAEDIYACLEAGMNGHISKPIEMQRVLEVLRRTKRK